jgi:cell division septum initiation protein DivIVA
MASAFDALTDTYYTRAEMDALLGQLRGGLQEAAADVQRLQQGSAALREQAASLADSTRSVLATLEAKVEQLKAFVQAQIDAKIARDAWPGLVDAARAAAADAAAEAAHRVLSQSQSGGA